jgi:hypothetical protein
LIMFKRSFGMIDGPDIDSVTSGRGGCRSKSGSSGDVGGDSPGLVAGEQLDRRAAPVRQSSPLPPSTGSVTSATACRCWLEVRRAWPEVRAEVERLQSVEKLYSAGAEQILQERDVLHSEIERLQRPPICIDGSIFLTHHRDCALVVRLTESTNHHERVP